MTGQVEASEGAVSTTNAVDPKLIGIRGWLILPAIELVVGPILSVVILIATFVMFSDYLRDIDGNTPLVFQLAVGVGLTLFSIYTAIQFFKKKRNVPSILITLMLLGIGVSILTYVVETHSGKRDEALVRLAIQGLSTAIWIPYFMISKRVKATSVN